MLVSLADMKIFLGITTSQYDAFLTQQITLISATVEAYCSRRFSATTYIQTFYKEDLINRDKVLDEVTCYQFPLISVASAVEKCVASDAGISVIDTFRINKPTAKLVKTKYQNFGWPCFFQYGPILEVTYTAGYATIPAPVSSVVYNLVQENYNKMVNGIDLNFGSDIEAIAIPGVLNIQYDFSLQNNKRDSTFGVILGSNANVLDFYRSERAVIGTITLAYIEDV